MISEVISGIFTIFHNLQGCIWVVVGLVETNFDDDIAVATIGDILSQSTPELTLEKLGYDF